MPLPTHIICALSPSSSSSDASSSSKGTIKHGFVDDSRSSSRQVEVVAAFSLATGEKTWSGRAPAPGPSSSSSSSSSSSHPSNKSNGVGSASGARPCCLAFADGLAMVALDGRATTTTFAWGRSSSVGRFAAPEQINALACSQGVARDVDGGVACAGGVSGVAYVWDVGTGALVSAWKAHYRPITVVAFSKDDGFLLTGSDDAFAQARPAPAHPAPGGGDRGQRRPRLVGSRNATDGGFRCRPQRPGGRDASTDHAGRVDVGA